MILPPYASTAAWAELRPPAESRRVMARSRGWYEDRRSELPCEQSLADLANVCQVGFHVGATPDRLDLER